MDPEMAREPRGGIGCLWLVLLVGSPLALLAAIGALITDPSGGAMLALALVAVALAAAMGSVWVRRAGLARAAEQELDDPVAALRATFGKRVARPAPAPPVIGGMLVPAHVSAPTATTLQSVNGVAAGDGRLPRGAQLGWLENGANLPRVELYSAAFNREVAVAVTGPVVPVEHPDLIDPWLVGAEQLPGLATLMGDPLIAALNALPEGPLALSFDGKGISAFTDGTAVMEPLVVSGCALGVRYGLPERLLVTKQGAPQLDAMRASARARNAREGAGLGRLASMGRVRAQWEGLAMAGTFLGIFSIGGVVTVIQRGVGGETIAGFLPGLLVLAFLAGVSAVVIAVLALGRLRRRQTRAAKEVRTAGRVLDLRYRAQDRSASQGWTRRPFAKVTRLVASPAASGMVKGVQAGLAFMSGDAGVGRFRARTFTSRVAWVEADRELPAVTFVREDLSERMLAILGGADVDVESAEFNRRWRVRADDARLAHAMLQPALIALLVDVADSGIAVHVDGKRVAVWDDGREGDVDMAQRLALAARFLEAIPAFVKR